MSVEHSQDCGGRPGCKGICAPPCPAYAASEAARAAANQTGDPAEYARAFMEYAQRNPGSPFTGGLLAPNPGPCTCPRCPHCGGYLAQHPWQGWGGIFHGNYAGQAR